MRTKNESGKRRSARDKGKGNIMRQNEDTG